MSRKNAAYTCEISELCYDKEIIVRYISDGRGLPSRFQGSWTNQSASGGTDGIFEYIFEKVRLYERL